MRGGGPDQTSILTALLPLLHVESLLIDRHRHQVNPCGQKSAPCAKVAGILQPDRIPWIKQGADGEIKRALCSSCDNHLFGCTAYSPGDADMRSDGLSQREVASRRLVGGDLT